MSDTIWMKQFSLKKTCLLTFLTFKACILALELNELLNCGCPVNIGYEKYSALQEFVSL